VIFVTADGASGHKEAYCNLNTQDFYTPPRLGCPRATATVPNVSIIKLDSSTPEVHCYAVLGVPSTCVLSKNTTRVYH